MPFCILWINRLETVDVVCALTVFFSVRGDNPKNYIRRENMSFASIIGAISGFMYSKLLIVILLVGGLYFTVLTRFVQFRFLGESIKVVLEKPDQEGSVSSFQALMVSTASRVGTGNIVGVATAICSGGFGAVFWMWVIAIIGGASAYV